MHVLRLIKRPIRVILCELHTFRNLLLCTIFSCWLQRIHLQSLMSGSRNTSATQRVKTTRVKAWGPKGRFPLKRLGSQRTCMPSFLGFHVNPDREPPCLVRFRNQRPAAFNHAQVPGSTVQAYGSNKLSTLQSAKNEPNQQGKHPEQNKHETHANNSEVHPL